MVNTVARQATSGGATVVRPVENQFYGDRAGKIQDPFGHIWWIATHFHRRRLPRAERYAK
jgi:PhnB protein